MKKSMIALLGLLTLVACSEDTYLDAENNTKNTTAENNSGENAMPKTWSPGYESPFWPIGSPYNKEISTTFRNNTPLTLELEPFGEDMHLETFLNANNVPYPLQPNSAPQINPISGGNFVFHPGDVGINSDLAGSVSVNLPMFATPLGNIVYDFGSFDANFRMLHYGKIYYFKYKISSHAGTIVDEGYIKHNFYNDANDWQQIMSSDTYWNYVSEVGNIPQPYKTVIMYHTTDGEMCITNEVGYTVPLPSSVNVVDPLTGVMHTLKFTSASWGMAVEFN